MAAMKIKLTPQQQQILVAAVLFIGGGGFAYVKYFWLPISTEITETRKKIDDVTKKITKAKVNAGKLAKIQAEYDRLTAKAAETEKNLPKEEDFPAVVDTISDLARKYNVVLKSFSTGASADKQHFIEISYTLNASAPYHDLGRFFAALVLEERIYNVRNVSFTPGGDTAFTLLTYKYKG